MSDALADLRSALDRSLTSADANQLIADLARALLRAGASAIHRLDPDSGHLRLIAVSGAGAPAAVADLQILPRAGLIGLVIGERRPIATPNFLADPRVTYAPDLRARLERRSCRAVLAVPLFAGDRVVGTLALGGPEGRVFGDDEVRLAQALAAQAAASIEYARLRELTDRSEREAERSAALLEAERSILEAVAGRAPLSRVLEMLCRHVERWNEGALASVFLLDPDGVHLRAGAAPSLPEAYVQAIDGIAAGPAVGSCGTAVHRRQRVIVTDIATDPLWAECRGAALEHGLRACWSVPILAADGRVLGTFATYYRAARHPIATELSVLERAVHIAAIAFEWRSEESARHAAETRLGGIVATAPDAIVTVDETQRIILFNESAERIFGYRVAEVIGQSLDLLLPPRYQDAHRGHVQEFGASPDVSRRMDQRREVIGRRKDGTEFPAAASILKIAHDRHITYTAILCDVSERKRAEEALRRSEARAHALIRDAAHAIFRVNDDGRLLDANPALARLLGYETEDELLGVNLRQLWVDTAARARVRHHFRTHEALAGLETEWLHRDGRSLVLRMSGRAVRDRQGRIESFEVIAEDVTERRALEAQLRQAQKMDAVGRLAGGIAHDFNNLLTVIIGRTALLLHRLAPSDPSRRDLDLIAKTAHRAVQLTRHLLAFSRKQVVQPRAVDLNQVLAAMTPMLERLLGEDVVIAVVPDPGAGTVRVDPNQVEQVIMNLAVNARDAMPGGGRLTMATSRAELDEEYARLNVGARPGAYVLLSVSDTGSGMDGDTLARIFEPFFTTKPPGKGTGLGLSVVYGIVTQSGGYIAVSSRPGEGTAFQIYFPRVDGPPEPLEPSIAPPVRSLDGSETVLLVEDAEDLRALIREILVEHGYHVLEALDAGDAVRIAEQAPEPIALLLTDVVMPAMHGPELAERVVALHPAMRVIYMSGYAEELLAQELLSALVLIQKPFSTETLLGVVRTTLDAPAPGP